MLWVVSILLLLVCVLCYLYTCFPKTAKSRQLQTSDIRFHCKNLDVISQLISAKNAYLLTPNICYLLESKQLASLDILAKHGALSADQKGKLAKLRPRIRSFKIQTSVEPICPVALENMQFITNKELLTTVEVLKKLVFSLEAKRYISPTIIDMEGKRLREINLRVGVSARLKDIELFLTQRQFETVERKLAEAAQFIADQKFGGEIERDILQQLLEFTEATNTRIAEIRQQDFQALSEQYENDGLSLPKHGEGLDDWDDVLGVRKKTY